METYTIIYLWYVVCWLHGRGIGWPRDARVPTHQPPMWDQIELGQGYVKGAFTRQGRWWQQQAPPTECQTPEVSDWWGWCGQGFLSDPGLPCDFTWKRHSGDSHAKQCHVIVTDGYLIQLNPYQIHYNHLFYIYLYTLFITFNSCIEIDINRQ